jgi:hypothetical protein
MSSRLVLWCVIVGGTFFTCLEAFGGTVTQQASEGVAAAGKSAQGVVLNAIALPSGSSPPPGASPPVVGTGFPVISADVEELAALKPTPVGDNPPPGETASTAKAFAQKLRANLRGTPTEMYMPAKIWDGSIAVVGVRKDATAPGGWKDFSVKTGGENPYVATLGATIARGGVKTSTYASTTAAIIPIGIMKVDPLNYSFFVARGIDGLLMRPVGNNYKKLDLSSQQWYPASKVLDLLAPLAAKHLEGLPKDPKIPPPPN